MFKNLDINTQKGQLTLRQEEEVTKRIKARWKVDVIETDKKRDATFDALLIKDNELKAVVEIKCRNMTLKEMEAWGNTWLITNQKIIDGVTISKLAKIPFIGILYLVPEDKILYWKVTDEEGNQLFDFEVAETQTQRTVNGGEIVRRNAFLHIKNSKTLK